MPKSRNLLNRPYHTGHSKLPPIQSVGGARAERIIAGLEPGTRVYQLGQCMIFVSPPFLGYGWHLSISHPSRYPTWDEVAKARYDLLPTDITIAQILPPPGEYVNVHEFCFHLHQIAPEDQFWGLNGGKGLEHGKKD